MSTETWTVETRRTHFFRRYGHVIDGFGPSMDPHLCGEGERCWTVVETRKVTPWTRDK